MACNVQLASPLQLAQGFDSASMTKGAVKLEVPDSQALFRVPQAQDVLFSGAHLTAANLGLQGKQSRDCNYHFLDMAVANWQLPSNLSLMSV